MEGKERGRREGGREGERKERVWEHVPITLCVCVCVGVREGGTMHVYKHMFHPTHCVHMLQELKKNSARTVVRCCDPSYDVDPLRKEGISVLVSDCMYAAY